MVRHPGSTGIVPIMDDGTVIMTFQYRHVVGEYLLEIPAGTMEPGNPLSSAQGGNWKKKRDLPPVSSSKLPRLISSRHTPMRKSMCILRGTLSPPRRTWITDEIIQVVKYPLDELMALIAEGKMTDALTILSLYRVEAYLQGGVRVLNRCSWRIRPPIGKPDPRSSAESPKNICPCDGP